MNGIMDCFCALDDGSNKRLLDAGWQWLPSWIESCQVLNNSHKRIFCWKKHLIPSNFSKVNFYFTFFRCPGALEMLGFSLVSKSTGYCLHSHIVSDVPFSEFMRHTLDLSSNWFSLEGFFYLRLNNRLQQICSFSECLEIFSLTVA